MTLKKLSFKQGINRETTRYSSEGGWWECDKVRFRSGNAQKIGGWQAVSQNTFQGVCRSLLPWVTIGGAEYTGVGTHLKYYILNGGAYYDITPLRTAASLTNPFSTTNGSATVTVTHAGHGASNGDFVVYSGASAVAGLTLNGEFQISNALLNTYQITASSNANATTTGGGAGVTATYQITVGTEFSSPFFGWGSGTWGSGTWGTGTSTTVPLRIWNAANFGEDLIYGPRGSELYYWSAGSGLGVRGTKLSSMVGASDVPSFHNLLLVSDQSRFVFVFGTNDVGSGTYDPLLIRWSDQEDATNWTPDATNQSGSLPLSRGSKIMARTQTRQEILVWTDIALYSLQYLGSDPWWGTQILANNVSIMSDRAHATVGSVTYWMGAKKFYVYSGDVRPLNCDLLQYVFSDFNYNQTEQVFAGVNERWNEIWWFYCSEGSMTVDRYVIFNYIENVWYHGNMPRTAWVDANVTSTYPLAATYNNKLVNHEVGVDNFETTTGVAIEAYLLSSEFDLDDGDHFGFVSRILPDVSFEGSTDVTPSVKMTMYPLKNSGSGYTSPASQGLTSYGNVTRTATIPVEAYTGQINIRIRGRQMAFEIRSTDLGIAWQLGNPRIDVRPDGRGA